MVMLNIETTNMCDSVLTKICTVCSSEFPATPDYWYRQKNARDGLRAHCKTCANDKIKKYKQRPEAKKRHRERMAKWRADNPEESLRISRENYKKHGAKQNAKKRERYANDPEYRQKKIERDRRYYESGRRLEMNAKPEQREKARIRSKKRREDPVKNSQDRAQQAIYREKNREALNEMHRNRRDSMEPSYVAQVLRISVKDMTPEIYETQKTIMLLRRELKIQTYKSV
jgi:hypothetical protein